MEIGIRNRAAAFDDLLPGAFFRALRGTERIFGFVVTDGPRLGAFLFSETGPGRQSPWLAPGGLPNDDLVSFPGAVIRVDPTSSSQVSGAPPFGAIINFKDKFYMRASDGVGNYSTCDVATGSLESIPRGVLNLYPEWQVGYTDADRFEPIFKFPSQNPPGL
jgi:hypothetical protein